MNEIEIIPEVNSVGEFSEITGDFGDPLEVTREGISNAYDHGATEISLIFQMTEDIFTIEIIDNGSGMSEKMLKENFWSLGNSSSKENKEKIGEKGHGTKIYLRSEKIEIWTSTGEEHYYSYCDKPYDALKRGKLHAPKFKSLHECERGTRIKLTNYSRDYSKYSHEIVKDYIYWFTKHGSVEKEFGKLELSSCIIKLKGLDRDKYEKLEFGHRFPKVNDNINELFELHDVDACDYFVKKYEKSDCLEKYPYFKYEVVIYVEGDSAKKNYNPMLGAKKTQKGRYKVSDRYGIYLCKDYIPVQRVNEWISNFGTGSNSFVMIHGFVNSQHFKLTANRGSITNTSVEELNALEEEIKEFIQEINIDLYKNNCLDALKSWQNEKRTMEVEREEFNARKRRIEEKKKITFCGCSFYEPNNEQETYAIFVSLYTLKREYFNFEPIDYNTYKGIDILARKNSDQPLKDCEYFYVELKYKLKKDCFNHSFENVDTIICWDLMNDIKDGTKMTSAVEQETGYIFKIVNSGEDKKYYIDNDSKKSKIEVIKLKDIIEKLTNV
ncbi:ATP-binding protein [Anaerorhabdus furcosa]|uniref:Histidine kinase-, DNA gyrase B-, and HSP90-like ATPase n=1 Tax=Anaerorhabdus furcosa TaxID=118967 RepID=A0A1T4K2K4_9FIRM|nr:ATP-binding protein [Anaerorhabdus furcosa]SJZ36609.1 Histidine kinase-, DNA gyrase B-, and HSP90-like ATPase [Anaerorhabdus furcosa]